MPDRIFHAALLDDDRFLGLPDNDCRMAYVAVRAKADDFGNFEASPGNLLRLWRELGIDSAEKVARVAAELEQNDMVRFYKLSTGRATSHFGHIPRFKQRVRHVKRTHPRPPAEIEDNENNDIGHQTSDERRTDDGRTTDERPTPDSRPPDARPASVGSRAPAEVKRREEKRSKFKSALSVETHTSEDVGATSPPATAKGNGALGKTVKAQGTAPGKVNGATGGQQWGSRPWVQATAKLVDVQQREGEDYGAFKDRVHGALQQRLKRPVEPP